MTDRTHKYLKILQHPTCPAPKINVIISFIGFNTVLPNVGVMSLVIIGAFHPLVIWFEYHFTQSIWPVFLIAGLLCLIAALFIQGLFSVLLGLLGVACIWSIRELKEQARRVERGWFPKNPKRK